MLRQGRGNATRIVDKLPDNFFYLGIVASLFPNATIIHALRHPLDTCLSCYFQNFTNVRWACDLDLIGERYRFYREIMDYWRSVLPEGRIVDISYEELIDDPKSQGRRLVEACGLNWDDKMLQFHEEDRIVKSASLWQVRQPIYRSSRMRWKNYASHLGTLADALSAYLQDDREELAQNGITLAAPSAMGRLKKLIG